MQKHNKITIQVDKKVKNFFENWNIVAYIALYILVYLYGIASAYKQ